MTDAIGLLKKQSPYFAACLSGSHAVNGRVNSIRELLSNGQAREALNLALEPRPNEPPVPGLVLAECYLACGAVDLALPLIKSALSGSVKYPAGPQVYVANLADAALPLLAKAMQEAPQNDAAETARDRYKERAAGDRGMVDTAAVLLDLGRPEAAEELYGDVLAGSCVLSSRKQALYGLLSARLSRGDLVGAASLLLEAGDRAYIPDVLTGPLGLTRSAKSLLESPSAPSCCLDFEARLLYWLGRREEALAKVDAYLSADKEGTGLLAGLACHAWDLQDLQVADKCITEVLDRSLPLDNAAFLTVLARRLSMAGDLGQAVETFGLALQSDPQSEDALSGMRELALKVKHAESLVNGAGPATGRVREVVASNPRVLVAGPVRQKPAILKEFLFGLAQLEVSSPERRAEVDFLFVDDNQDAQSSLLLRDFRPPSGQVFICPSVPDGKTYRCDDVTHTWTADLIDKVGTMKDFMIEFALDAGYDYLFLVDSDLVLHPKTLQKLLWADRDVVSEVFWSKWQPDSPVLPQVWVKDHYDMYKFAPDEKWDKDEALRRANRFVQSLQTPGTYEVGGLGACTLIKAEALRAGLRFRRIDNLSLSGEDRFFCARAAALGYAMHAETTYPPLHLYRDEDLARVQAFWDNVRGLASRQSAWPVKGLGTRTVKRRTRHGGGRLTLSMLVRNEADRYLRQVLEDAAQYVDEAVILDDASEDATVQVCREVFDAAGVPLTVVTNATPGFHNDVELRKQQWELTLATEPDWVLSLDADEVFEGAAKTGIRRLLEQQEADTLGFRVYDMWDPEHYRDDAYWKAHEKYFPLLVRYQPRFPYAWRETPVHCGRLPENILLLPVYCSDLRIKHLGWMDPDDRRRKYQRYKQSDPEGRFGVSAQYESILDPRPRLAKWIE